ncbi:porin [Azospirillum rugosum]|uniref:Porin domain-containing protein n=1 Tax=Azospirillum rugosum TaxID=416170 RepID=A0ABS4SFB2_9PROT|nr:porin [Azospirillum rugosum]MBP2290632.1 hypothetical protein [Azospirillum rugosum]MDQ0525520.1 hypothetical protein [Azospirillum rugosum]
MARTRSLPPLILSLLLTLSPFATQAASELPNVDPRADETVPVDASFEKRAFNLGPWGAIEIGQTESAQRRLVVTSPVRDPWFTDSLFVDDGAFGSPDARATYYSPRLSGFRVGLGYTPIRTEPGVSDPVARHLMEGVIRNEGKVGAARYRLTVGAGKAQITDKERGTPRQSWVIGGQLALRGLTLGAGYREQMPDIGPPRRTFNAGLMLERGTTLQGWSLTGRLAHTQLGDELPQEAWSTGLRYRMSPQVSVSADLGTMTYDGGPATSTMLRLGTRVLF